MMTRILLGGGAVLIVLLGLAAWRIDNLSSKNALLTQDVATAVAAAAANDETIKFLQGQRKRDQEASRQLQRRYEALHTSNANLRERLKNEEDGPTAPVLRCAVDERLCKPVSGDPNKDGGAGTPSQSGPLP